VNDRNVTALALALQGAPGLAEASLDAIARHLARRGVLAPVALTDDEAVKIGADAAGTLPTEPGEIALCVREGLTRIARG
jgi:D-alanyl-D-alanine carboxypeptidase